MIKELKSNNIGKIVGSDEYFDAINSNLLKGLMPKNKGRNHYYNLYKEIEHNLQSKKYAAIVLQYQVTKNNCKTNLRKLFEPVAAMIVQDIAHASKENYIKDENGSQLNTALKQLKLCHVASLDNTIRKIDKLCWYIDVSERKVKELQKLLNQLGYGPLEVSGVYDAKTDKAWVKLVSEIELGKFTKLSNQAIAGMNVVVEYTDMVHITVTESKIFVSSQTQSLLNNINQASKIVEIGKKTVIVSSLVLDALELGLSIEKDLTDADKKIGKKTWTTAAEIGGSWAGLWLGAKIGSRTGALIGGPVGTIAGAMTGFAAALILSEWGEKLGEYIIDLTDLQ